MHEPEAPAAVHQAQVEAMSQRSRQLPGRALHDPQRGKLS